MKRQTCLVSHGTQKISNRAAFVGAKFAEIFFNEKECYDKFMLKYFHRNILQIPAETGLLKTHCGQTRVQLTQALLYNNLTKITAVHRVKKYKASHKTTPVCKGTVMCSLQSPFTTVRPPRSSCFTIGPSSGSFSIRSLTS